MPNTFTLPAGYTAQTALTEGRHTGGFMVSFANGHLSIDRGILEAGQLAVLPVGAILGIVSASGKYTLLNPAAADGSQNAAGILFDTVDATHSDVHCAVVVRDAEVNLGELDYGTLTAAQQSAALVQLAANHVIARA